MSKQTTLDGPRLAPASGNAARQLVILLHGVGADGNNLIGLAPQLAAALPDAAFVAPDAPWPCDMAPYGRQWFSILEPDAALREAAIRGAGEILSCFIDDELARHAVADDRLAVVGFSQGTMMALFSMLRRTAACAGILGYSGRLDLAASLAAEISARPPVRLIHGAADDLLPVSLMAEAEAVLRANGVALDCHIRPGLGHGIDEGGIALGIEFLGRVLAAR